MCFSWPDVLRREHAAIQKGGALMTTNRIITSNLVSYYAVSRIRERIYESAGLRIHRPDGPSLGCAARRYIQLARPLLLPRAYSAIWPAGSRHRLWDRTFTARLPRPRH